MQVVVCTENMQKERQTLSTREMSSSYAGRLPGVLILHSMWPAEGECHVYDMIFDL